MAAGGGRLIGRSRWQHLHWRLLRWLFGGWRRPAAGRFGSECAPALAGRAPGARVRPAADRVQPARRPRRHDFHRRRADLALRPAPERRLQGDPGPRPECRSPRRPASPGAARYVRPRRVRSAHQRAHVRARPSGNAAAVSRGRNIFTPERRRSAVHRLWRKGRRRSAARAETMSHVLPPQPGGALAALSAREHVDVVFAAHTGLGLAAYPRQFWREMPLGRTLHTRLWLVPADDVHAAATRSASAGSTTGGSGSTNGSTDRTRARPSPSEAEPGASGPQAAAGCSDRPDRAGRSAAARSSGMPIHLLNFWGASGFEKW